MLATQIAKSRSETVKYLQQRALGPRGELYPVAFLCGQSDGMGAWIIQTDMAHRYLVAFDVPGSELDACQKEDTRTPIFIGSGRHNALRFYMGHRGGYDDYRVAVRGGRPVVIWHESLNDNRAGDVPVVRDFDKHGRDFEDANSMMPGKMKLVLLDARGTEQREDQNR